MIIDINYFINNQNEFKRISRKHECEIPKGDCWQIKVEHLKTGKVYEYYEEDCYYSLSDQLDDSISDLELFEVVS